MTDHLPECPRSSIPDKYADAAAKIGIHAGDCICEPLRACEQRVRLQVELTHEREWIEARDGGYTAGLDAARQAVERCRTDLRGYLDKTDALATIEDIVNRIDAFKEGN